MQTTVREAIVKIFKAENIETILGHTGGHIMLLWDSIEKAGIRAVFNKQEGNAVYMADSYAKLTRTPSIILGTSGPGVQNMVAGIASAYMDSVPMIIIGAGVPTFALGRNALQESSGRGRATSQLDIFKGITKQASLAAVPELIPRLVREAFRIATTDRPGPVYIEIPSDYWDREIEFEELEPHNYKNNSLPGCSVKDIDAIIKKLNQANKPVILLGEGALDANINKEFADFIDKVKIPFFVAPKAKDFVDEYSEYFIGALRVHSKVPQEYGYLTESDFILSLGNRMEQWQISWVYDNSIFGDAKFAQIDPDPSEIGKVFNVDYSSVGSIQSFINSPKHVQHKNSDNLLEFAKEYNYKLIRPRRYEDSDKIHPLNLNNITEETLPDNAIVVVDTAYAGSMAINKFRTNATQRFVLSDNNSPMGYALPAAIGATFYTDDTVICFIGDGSFQMTCNELGTLMNYNKKIIVIIENNEGCISIKNNMIDYYDKNTDYCNTVFDSPDFVDLAHAYGIDGAVVTTSVEYEQILKRALNGNNSFIIDAHIDQDLMIWE